MTFRIIVNGQEFSTAETLPAGVRAACEEALSRLKDGTGKGIPDALERGDTDVIKIESSALTVNGREFKTIANMPAALRVLFEYASRQAESGGHGRSSLGRDAGELVEALLPRAHSEHFLQAHYEAKRSAERILPVLLALVIGGMMIGGVWLFRQHPDISVGTGVRFALVLIGFTIVLGAAAVILTRHGLLDSTGSEDSAQRAQRGAAQSSPGEPPENLSSSPSDESDSIAADHHRGLDSAQSTMGVLLAFAAGFVLIFSVGLMFNIGGGRAHLAGRLYVAIGALLLLGWLDTHASRLAQRRRPLLGPDPAGYRRFVVWSGLGLFVAAAGLLGLAWFLP